MSSLTLQNIPVALLEQLRTRADQAQRSLDREIICLLERVLESSPDRFPQLSMEIDAQLCAWERLAARWHADPHDAAVCEEIYQSRTLGREFSL